MGEDIGSHRVLRSRGVAGPEHTDIAIVINDGLGQTRELGMTAAEILLAVIRAGACRGLADGAAVVRQ